MGSNKVRIMMAKPGLDVHDRGVKIVVRFLREAGFEVLYSGSQQTPEEIVDMAILENINLLGLSCLSGAHCYLFSSVTRLIEEKGASNVRVIGGGDIPERDFRYLHEHGIEAIFASGSSLATVLDWIEKSMVN